MLLAASGVKAATPGVNLSVSRFRIHHKIESGKTTLRIEGDLNMPELGLQDGDLTEAVITVEVKEALPNGDDLRMIDEFPVSVKEEGEKIKIEN